MVNSFLFYPLTAFNPTAIPAKKPIITIAVNKNQYLYL